ncbi:MAG: CBS domain-containing protein, partial [Thermodesulfobacteriota bacterium]
GAEASGPVFWEGQFETECREGSAKRVSEIMGPFRGCAREDEMLMEAVFLFNKYQVKFLPVINREDVTGMIHLEDIEEEMSRVVLGESE